jgi:hypothetical protein
MATPRILLCQHSSNIAVTLPIMQPHAPAPAISPPSPPSLQTRSRAPSDAPPLQMLAQNASARSAFDGSPVFSSVRVSHETASSCGQYCAFLQTDGANSSPEERLIVLQLRQHASSKQLQKLSSRSVAIPGGVFSMAFTANSSFLLILQDAQRRSRIFALHIPTLMRSEVHSCDVHIRDAAFAVQLCEGVSSSFHCSPWARNDLVAITCDTELLLIRLLCSCSNIISSHCLRRIQGCSVGYAPQLVAHSVLFLQPGGVMRVGEAGEWGGEVETVAHMGSFSATRDGRYVAVKREGHGVSWHGFIMKCLTAAFICWTCIHFLDLH